LAYSEENHYQDIIPAQKEKRNRPSSISSELKPSKGRSQNIRIDPTINNHIVININ